MAAGTFNILESAEKYGGLRFEGANAVGDQLIMQLNNVLVTPSGDIGFIQDEWGQMELTGECLVDADGIFGTLTHPDTGKVSPLTSNYYIGKGIVFWRDAFALATTADTTNTDATVTLTASTGLVNGQQYAISGPGIPAGATFTYAGVLAVELDAPYVASATATDVAVVINGPWRDVGNAPELTFSMDLDALPHYSSRQGTRVKDLTVNRTKSATFKLVLEEFTYENLKLVMMGEDV